MNSRTKALTTASILAAALLALPSAAHAAVGPVDGVTVGGVSPTGPEAITGFYKSGTSTFAGFTAGCASGSISGSVGPAAQIGVTGLTMICDTGLGIDANIALASGCSVTAVASGTVHDGLVDGTDPAGGPYGPVGFELATVATNCVVVTMDGGCSYRVDGTLTARFRETVTTVSGVQYQDLVLSGSGLQTRGANFLCFGLVPNGSVIALNAVTFGVRPTGTPHRPIDFVPAP